MTKRLMLIWVALIGFILGTSVCPFGDLNDGTTVEEMMKEKTAMSTAIDQVNTTVETRVPAEAASPNGLEIATFGLG